MSTPTPTADHFDDANITWHTLEGIEHLSYQICNVDRDRGIVDILFKFSAQEKIVLHRHHADYITLVLQGELRLYNAKGDLTEVRPIGSYVQGKAGGEPHSEGGGDEDVIAFFSNRGVTDIVYEVLDADLNRMMTLGLNEFQALFDAQGQG